jgi:hypothetical protein
VTSRERGSFNIPDLIAYRISRSPQVFPAHTKFLNIYILFYFSVIYEIEQYSTVFVFGIADTAGSEYVKEIRLEKFSHVFRSLDPIDRIDMRASPNDEFRRS